jgi:ribonucleotide reductase alpha subunit
MRNSVRSANAPTGTIAIFSGQVSNGIEPVYMK